MNTVQTPNVALLRQTLAHIEAHPEEWEQGDWQMQVSRPTFCGTAYCFAGRAAVLSGAVLKRVGVVVLAVHPDLSGSRRIDDYAANLLGIEHTRANYDGDWDDDGTIPLFEGDNTLDDLRRIVGELCATAEAQVSQ